MELKKKKIKPIFDLTGTAARIFPVSKHGVRNVRILCMAGSGGPRGRRGGSRLHEFVSRCAPPPRRVLTQHYIWWQPTNSERRRRLRRRPRSMRSVGFIVSRSADPARSRSGFFVLYYYQCLVRSLKKKINKNERVTRKQKSNASSVTDHVRIDAFVTLAEIGGGRGTLKNISKSPPKKKLRRNTLRLYQWFFVAFAYSL